MRGYPHHIDLTVKNIEESISFYDLVLPRLGYRREELSAGEAPSWCCKDEFVNYFGIALHQADNQEEHDRYSAGLHHLAFHAENREEVDDFHKFLLANQIEILDAPEEYDYTPGYYAVFFSDPNGIKLEVVHEPR